MNKIFYQIYHGNLAFSAIEEDALGEVIDKCYFPLLELVKKENLKIGLELSGYSLKKIKELRPQWIKKFKKLHKQGTIELLGSGYMQIIGPLVPYEINLNNQTIGLEVYKEILGIVPSIAYINEQVFSKSMVDLYAKVGYTTIAMEWNNAYSIHYASWKAEYAFQPVIIQGLNTSLPVLWTDTIVFQQFQRVIHQEMDENRYIDMIQNYLDLGYKSLAIYSSDLEIFNYRPGRFETEAVIYANEWEKIAKVVKKLRKLGNFNLPSQVIEKLLDTNIKLDLTTASHPILVKKQNKYSLSRWAACGRGANYINTLCYNYFHNMTNKVHIKKLLQYWGSDYRTHTTLNKWHDAINFLSHPAKAQLDNFLTTPDESILIDKNSKLIFEKDNYKIIFNKDKGLTLERILKNGKKLEFGTVYHGELQHIAHGADFYTGTTTLESADTGKITNLHKITTYTFDEIDKGIYILSTTINMKNIATETKKWIIDFKNDKITLDIKLATHKFINGSIRLGTLTLLPQDRNSNLWYECKNGGNQYERFYIKKSQIKHNCAKSLIQSSNGGLGVTNGILRFGAGEKLICQIELDRNISYPFVMLQNSYDVEKYLTRVFFSTQELDDTLKPNDIRVFNLRYHLSLS